jgi:hypothetical protein
MHKYLHAYEYVHVYACKNTQTQAHSRKCIIWRRLLTPSKQEQRQNKSNNNKKKQEHEYKKNRKTHVKSTSKHKIPKEERATKNEQEQTRARQSKKPSQGLEHA